MQIDTTENKGEQGVDAPAIRKERIKEQVEKFMAQRDLHKRTEKLIGAKGNRLGISLDELLQFDEELSDYVRRYPIEAINMFEGQLDNMIKDMKDDGGKDGQNEK
jgi:DNA replicative helicase MCM subunit Mcm2 (Cdc46/Mcm family)